MEYKRKEIRKLVIKEFLKNIGAKNNRVSVRKLLREHSDKIDIFLNEFCYQKGIYLTD